MDFSGLSLEELQKFHEYHRSVVEWSRNKLDEVRRERREEQERLKQEYGDNFITECLGFGECTGLDGLCITRIQDGEKMMVEIEAEMERRKPENGQKR